ncbi:protein atonal homolog 8-like isoform X2 [Anneissia japonica]|uniref:protein atonal homolog 8-like isoform X2 n=1 Tax=Anneissia japonica TaxID=1529436 RepID=UPI0014255BE1|nr:protein atonal homolog 8-like isoform X2 [Anneissia japonica]
MHSTNWAHHQPVNGTSYSLGGSNSEAQIQRNINIGAGPAECCYRATCYSDSCTGDVYDNMWDTIHHPHYPTGSYGISGSLSTNEASIAVGQAVTNSNRNYIGHGKSHRDGPVIRDPPPVTRSIPQLPFAPASNDYNPVVLPKITNTDVHAPVSVRPISVGLPTTYQPPITIPTYPHPNAFTMPAVVQAPASFEVPGQYVPIRLPAMFKQPPPTENIQIYRPQSQRVVPRSYQSTSVRELLKAKARYSNNYHFSPLRCTKRVKSTRVRAIHAANTDLNKTNSEKRRVANARERERVSNLNSGFEKLRKHLPGIERYKNRKCSKVDTLRFAINYIHQLERTLWEDDMCKNRVTSATEVNRDVSIWHVVPVNPGESGLASQVTGYKAYQVI